MSLRPPPARRRFLGLAAAALVAPLVAAVPPTASAAPAGVAQAGAQAAAPRPIVFVHGALGSGSQVQTQAKRFAANGYPADWIEAHDYDSLFQTASQAQVLQALDQRIAALKQRTGADKVELVGHSLGTSVSQSYLSTPARAANVAHYVNIDGSGASSLPGGVPTLAIWGEGNNGSITGATNLRLPDQSHVQTTSSVETFDAEYRFFTGQAPATTDVVPESGPIRLAGRALSFPANTPLSSGVTVSLWEVDPQTGRRTGTTPLATATPAADGSFGPFTASGTASYEFAVTSGGRTLHSYSEPFRRTDLGIRLLVSAPGGTIDGLLEKSAAHTNLLLNRNKEWWGDQGANGDSLTVDGTSVLNYRSAPRSKRAIALFAYDVGRNRRSSVLGRTPSGFRSLPFISAVDLYVPAAAPPNRSVVLVSRPRGGGGATHRIAVPNWPSSTDAVTVTFDDFT